MPERRAVAQQGRSPTCVSALHGSPANYRAREVTEITTAKSRGKMSRMINWFAERDPFALVRVAGHLTASNDRVASRFSSRAHHGEFHLNA